MRSLFRYAALRHPEHAQLILQVLAIPQKRYDKTTVPFLETNEVEALLAAPDPDRWEGRRDHALIAVAVQTGLRLASSPESPAAISNSASAPTSGAPGKAAKNDASR